MGGLQRQAKRRRHMGRPSVRTQASRFPIALENTNSVSSVAMALGHRPSCLLGPRQAVLVRLSDSSGWVPVLSRKGAFQVNSSNVFASG